MPLPFPIPRRDYSPPLFRCAKSPQRRLHLFSRFVESEEEDLWEGELLLLAKSARKGEERAGQSGGEDGPGTLCSFPASVPAASSPPLSKVIDF